MNTVETPYGPLGPVDFVEWGPQGHATSCVPQGPLTIITSLGSLTAQHSTNDSRRPKIEPIEFHPNGMLKSLALENRTRVPTPIGTIEAELVTFYQDGSLRRVFPLNGKLSGYWTEKEESSLTEAVSVPTPAGTLKAKVVNVQFYPSGAIRSVTLWPGETVAIDTPAGRYDARIGVAFYPDGALRSFEPARMITVPTPLGPLEAFDPDAQGIHGDMSSLGFHEDGSMAALASPLNTVEVIAADGTRRTFAPDRVPNLCDERVKDISPLRIFFHPGRIVFGQDPPQAFPTAGHTFTVGRFIQDCLGPIAYDCGGCG